MNHALKKYANDIRNTWTVINDVLNKNKNNASFPEYFVYNNSEINSGKDIANHFNEFFINIGLEQAQTIQTPQKHFHSYLGPTVDKLLNFQAVDVKYLSKIIKELPNKTSVGHDGISTKLCKTIEASVLKPITFIINQALETGIFPQKLKIAKVSLIYKKVITKYLVITDPYPFYQTYLKFLKKLSQINYTLTSLQIIYFIQVNMDFEKMILLNMQFWK